MVMMGRQAGMAAHGEKEKMTTTPSLTTAVVMVVQDEAAAEEAAVAMNLLSFVAFRSHLVRGWALLLCAKCAHGMEWHDERASIQTNREHLQST